MPSVVLAEASWYGSLRGGVNFGGGEDARFADGYSRFGIQGSAEASEGLTAVYRFEHAISTEDGTLSYPRLAYIGLSGGFGNLTVGQIWSASYNHAGVVVDKSNYYGAHETSGRHGNAVSYAFSSGAVSFQADLVADGGMETGGSVDKAEFGLTVGLGDIGKVAFAHTNMKDTKKTVMHPVQYWVDVDGDADTDDLEKANQITITVAANDTTNVDSNDMLTDEGRDAVTGTDGKYSIGSCNATDSAAPSACKDIIAYVTRKTVRGSSDDNTENDTNSVTDTMTETFYSDGTKTGGNSETMVDSAGHKTSHVGFEFKLGGLTTHLAHTQKKVNGANVKSKTTHFGVTGALGDSGVNIVALARAKKDGTGTNTNPWLIGFSKSLGGGAKAYFEHGNNDDGESGNSRLGLIVSF